MTTQCGWGYWYSKSKSERDLQTDIANHGTNEKDSQGTVTKML